MEQKTPGISPLLLVLVLCLVTVGFRVVHLQADPPGDFSWSGGYFADEGFWSHNARSEVLFGTPVMDEWNAYAVSPVFETFQKWMFHAFGVGFVQVRVIGILSAVLIAVCSFFLFRTRFDDRTAALLSFLITLNYPMLVLARQGILDPFSAALAWAALALLSTEKKASAFAAGVILIACFVTKYLMIFLLLPFAFFVNERRSVLIPFVAGFVVTGLLWLFIHYLPYRDLLQSYNAFYASQQSWQPVQVMKNVVMQPFFLYFVKTPALLFFGNVMMWFLLFKTKETSGVIRVCWLWLVCGILFFALWKYRPLRYYTSLLLPLATLAGLAVYRYEEIRAFLSGSARSRYILWTGIAIPAVQVTIVLIDRWLGLKLIPAETGIPALASLVFLGLTVSLLWIRTARHAAIAFLLAFLLADVRSYLSWMMRPEYMAIQVSKDLQQRVGNGILTGQWAPELCLKNRVRCVPVWKGFVNSRDPFNRYGITHVLQWHYGIGGEKFQEWYPSDFKEFKPVKTYRIKNSDVILYEK